MQFDLSILWLQPTLQPGVSMNYLPLLSTLAYEWECCRASALSFSISCTWLLLTSLYSGVFGVLHSMDTAREEEVAKPLAPIACSWHICTHNTGILAPGLKPAIIIRTNDNGIHYKFFISRCHNIPYQRRSLLSLSNWEEYPGWPGCSPLYFECFICLTTYLAFYQVFAIKGGILLLYNAMISQFAQRGITALVSDH